MTTFVSVGNARQPFNRLLSSIDDLAAVLPSPVTVQYGNNKYNNSKYQCIDFLDIDDFNRNISISDLVITHAGAGSIITALTSGKIPVVMPRRKEYGELVDDHQIEFVNELAEKGLIIIAENESALRSSIEKAEKFNKSTKREKTNTLVKLVSKAVQELLPA